MLTAMSQDDLLAADWSPRLRENVPDMISHQIFSLSYVLGRVDVMPAEP